MSSEEISVLTNQLKEIIDNEQWKQEMANIVAAIYEDLQLLKQAAGIKDEEEKPKKGDK